MAKVATTKIKMKTKKNQGLVHPKMKISLCFTHPWAILGVYDFLLSDESNWSNIKNCPGYSKLYHCSGRVFLFNSENTLNKTHASIIKHASHGSEGE